MRKIASFSIALLFISGTCFAQTATTSESPSDQARQQAMDSFNQTVQQINQQEAEPEPRAAHIPPPHQQGQVRPVPYSGSPAMLAPPTHPTLHPGYSHPYYVAPHPYSGAPHPYAHPNLHSGYSHPYYLAPPYSHPYPTNPYYSPYQRPYTATPYSHIYAPPPALTPRPIIRRPVEPSTNPWVKQNPWEPKRNPWIDKPNPWRPPVAPTQRTIQNPPAGTFVPPITQQAPPQIYVTPPVNNPPVNSPTTY